jgi:hypothetical protein
MLNYESYRAVTMSPLMTLTAILFRVWQAQAPELIQLKRAICHIVRDDGAAVTLCQYSGEIREKKVSWRAKSVMAICRMFDLEDCGGECVWTRGGGRIFHGLPL